jgi:integrase
MKKPRKEWKRPGFRDVVISEEKFREMHNIAYSISLDFALLMLVAYRTGYRISDLLNMKWYFDGKELGYQIPKNHVITSKGTIGLFPEEVLKQILNRMNGRILQKSSGKEWNIGHVGALMGKLRERTGNDFYFGDLRRSFFYNLYNQERGTK